MVNKYNKFQKVSHLSQSEKGHGSYKIVDIVTVSLSSRNKGHDLTCKFQSNLFND